MGVKQSGRNPFQLKVGERSQPASKVGHFSLQIKKRKIHLAVLIVEECRKKGQGERDRRSKRNVCMIYGNLATSKQNRVVTCCHEKKKRTNKKPTTNQLTIHEAYHRTTVLQLFLTLNCSEKSPIARAQLPARWSAIKSSIGIRSQWTFATSVI